MRKWMSILIILICSLPTITEATANEVMRVHFIDVGQGDSILIETPEGQSILIDGGSPEEGKNVVTYLEEQEGLKELDIVIATHPHIDHIGGLIQVMKTFPVNKLIQNGRIHWTRTYASYRMALYSENIPIQIVNKTETMHIADDVDIQLIHMDTKANNHNQSSIVVKVTYDEIDFLLLSDVEAEQEKAIANKYDVEAEIIKVAHHGSKTSSSYAFLKQVNPEEAIISYGRDNPYGHPVSRVINNLSRVEAAIYSTAAYGDVVVETNGKDYIISSTYNPVDRLAE